MQNYEFSKYNQVFYIISALLSYCLAVFQEFVLVVGVGIGMFVARLLVEQLGFEQVAHLTGAGLVVVAIKTEILFSLFYRALGYLKLLVRLLDIVPRFLHANLQQL